MTEEINQLCMEKFKQMDKHIDESGPVRILIEQIKGKVNEMVTLKCLIGSTSSIIGAVLIQSLIFAFYFGGMSNQVKVNTERIGYIEKVLRVTNVYANEEIDGNGHNRTTQECSSFIGDEIDISYRGNSDSGKPGEDALQDSGNNKSRNVEFVGELEK